MFSLIRNGFLSRFFDYLIAKGVRIDGLWFQMRRQEGDKEKNRQENGEEKMKCGNGG
jgi:hypothetical protein